MKILAVADEESRFLWDFYEKEKLKDIQLILSCGDLDACRFWQLLRQYPCSM